MRKKCWSLSLRPMIQSPVSPQESPILTITIFPLLFNYHLPRTIKLKCRLHLWTFSNSLKHKSFSFSATNCKILCPTFSLTWSPNSAMCFHCESHSNSSRRKTQGQAITQSPKNGRSWRLVLLSSGFVGCWWLVLKLEDITWYARHPSLKAALDAMNWKPKVILSNMKLSSTGKRCAKEEIPKGKKERP